jgi:RNA polymerase sigma-70 factor (ECF subfamily)
MVRRPRRVEVAVKQGDESEVRRLVREARAGDRAAFSRLVEMHMVAMHSLGYRLLGNHDDADDVAQETFVRAFRALDRYDEQYSFYTWLRTIATRVALNEIEKRKRRQTAGGESFEAAAEVVASTSPDPSDLVAGGQLASAIRTALQTLPEDFRAVLALRTYEQMSYEEIADVLGIPIGTVMSRLNRARRMMREAWQRRSEGELEKGRKRTP